MISAELQTISEKNVAITHLHGRKFQQHKFILGRTLTDLSKSKSKLNVVCDWYGLINWFLFTCNTLLMTTWLVRYTCASTLLRREGWLMYKIITEQPHSLTGEVFQDSHCSFMGLKFECWT